MKQCQKTCQLKFHKKQLIFFCFKISARKTGCPVPSVAQGQPEEEGVKEPVSGVEQWVPLLLLLRLGILHQEGDGSPQRAGKLGPTTRLACFVGTKTPLDARCMKCAVDTGSLRDNGSQSARSHQGRKWTRTLLRDSTVRRVSKGPLGKTNYVLESLIVLVKELGQAVGPLTGLLLSHTLLGW